MGPLALSGLAIFGAIVAIGRLAAAPRMSMPATPPLTPGRRLALIFTAFAEGHGVLGVVVGLLAIVRGIEIDPTTASFVVILAVAATGIAVLPVIRNRSDLDPWVVSMAVRFVGGLVVLAVVLVILAAVIHQTSRSAPPPWAFSVLGIVSAAASISLGFMGLESIQAVAAADEAAVAAMSSRAIARIVPLQGIAVVAIGIGIVLVSAGR